MEGEKKKSSYMVIWAEHNGNEHKDALDCGVFEDSMGTPTMFGSMGLARAKVLMEIKSYIEPDDYETVEDWERALRACVWRGYEDGAIICEEHCGIETVYRIVEVS
jgi:hypothetical protein